MAISKEQPLRPYVQELGADFDELAESVQSGDIISVDAVQSFDTVADMQAATTLVAGMTCHTNGFHAEGDGGAAYYKVAASGDIALQDGLYASEVNVSISNATIDEITNNETPSSDGVLDETGLAHLWGNIKGYTDSEDAALKKSIDTNVQGVVETNYVGRLYLQEYAYTNVQGMCLLDSDTVLCALSDSTTTNECLILKISLVSGAVLETYTSDFAHCNDMAYNSTNEKIYVCPNNDYSVSPAVGVNYIYKVDPETLDIENTIDLGFCAQSIGYDKVTGKMYIVGCAANTNIFTLYEYDYSNDTTSVIRSFSTTDMIDAFTYRTGTTGGYQAIAVHDGVVSFLFSGEGNNYLLQLDCSTGAFLKVVNISPDVFLYAIKEAEGIDCFDNGTLLIYSYAEINNQTKFAVLSFLNLTGKTVFRTTYNTQIAIAQQNIYCNDSNGANASILQQGSFNVPFGTFAEAIAMQEQNKTARIYVIDHITIKSDMAPAMFLSNLYIVSSNTCVIEIQTKFNTLGTVFINGLSKMTILLKNSSYEFENHGILNFLNCKWKWDTTKATPRVVDNWGVLQCSGVTVENAYTGSMVQGEHVGLAVMYNSSGVTMTNNGALS